MTGALNTNAEWGEGVTFPKLEVTWSYAEHKDSLLKVTEISAASRNLTIPDGVTVKTVTLIQSGGNRIVAQSGRHYTFSNGILSMQATMLSGNVGGSLEIELDQNGTTKTETVTIK